MVIIFIWVSFFICFKEMKFISCNKRIESNLSLVHPRETLQTTAFLENTRIKDAFFADDVVSF